MQQCLITNVDVSNAVLVCYLYHLGWVCYRPTLRPTVTLALK